MQSGTNLEQIKDYNQGVVLQIIRDRDGVSRVEIAQRTGLTRPTVSNIVGRLLALGLVAEVGRTKVLVGKPRVTVRTNPDGAYALGARIGRRETESVLVDFDGRVVARTVQPTAGGPAAVVEQIAQEVAGLVRESGIAPEKIVGLGVACPGPLDHASGWVHSPPNFPGWGDVPLSKMLETATGYRVALDNNSRAAAVGERWAGAARGIDDFVMVYMGSGPSASFVVRGDVFRGPSGRAGAFGHVTLHAAEGDPCACGGRGCVDLHCAPADTVAAVEAAVARGESSVLADNELFQRERRADRFDLVKQAVLAGDPVASRELERTMRQFGHGVVMLLSIFDVGVVVLGGWGFRRVAEHWRNRIQAILQAHDRADVDVRVSATDDPSAIGGAALALHAAFAPRLNGLVPRDGVMARVGPKDPVSAGRNRDL